MPFWSFRCAQPFRLAWGRGTQWASQRRGETERWVWRAEPGCFGDSTSLQSNGTYLIKQVSCRPSLSVWLGERVDDYWWLMMVNNKTGESWGNMLPTMIRETRVANSFFYWRLRQPGFTQVLLGLLETHSATLKNWLDRIPMGYWSSNIQLYWRIHFNYIIQ